MRFSFVCFIWATRYRTNINVLEDNPANSPPKIENQTEEVILLSKIPPANRILERLSKKLIRMESAKSKKYVLEIIPPIAMKAYPIAKYSSFPFS